jgi:hypothetical protein
VGFLAFSGPHCSKGIHPVSTDREGSIRLHVEQVGSRCNPLRLEFVPLRDSPLSFLQTGIGSVAGFDLQPLLTRWTQNSLAEFLLTLTGSYRREITGQNHRPTPTGYYRLLPIFSHQYATKYATCVKNFPILTE